MLSRNDVIELIKKEVSYLSADGNSVAAIRHRALLHALKAVEETGFPTNRDLRLDLSLVPFVFQEANYDDINWTDRQAPLHHLSEMFSIDVAVQMGGRERHEMNDAEYKDYVDTSFAAIDYRTK